MNQPTLRPAHPDDLPLIQTWIQETGLHLEEVEEATLHRFLLAEQAGQPVGCGALEVRGPYGLLRSLLVVPAARGQGIGSALVKGLETAALAQGVRELYLLTIDGAGFFRRNGYWVINRVHAPEAVKSGIQFRALCPINAVCLAKEIGGDA